MVVDEPAIYHSSIYISNCKGYVSTLWISILLTKAFGCCSCPYPLKRVVTAIVFTFQKRTRTFSFTKMRHSMYLATLVYRCFRVPISIQVLVPLAVHLALPPLLLLLHLFRIPVLSR